jgi:hypothetical protein
MCSFQFNLQSKCSPGHFTTSVWGMIVWLMLTAGQWAFRWVNLTCEYLDLLNLIFHFFRHFSIMCKCSWKLSEAIVVFVHVYIVHHFIISLLFRLMHTVYFTCNSPCFSTLVLKLHKIFNLKLWLKLFMDHFTLWQWSIKSFSQSFELKILWSFKTKVLKQAELYV